MNRIFFSLASLIFLASILYTQNKLKFSAETVESKQENGISINFFKKNVKIEDANRVLYADLAKQIPDSNKVILTGNVQMYENNSSLKCNKLIMRNEKESYHAEGNVIFKDSLRTAYGDSLSIEYTNNSINKLELKSNAQVYIDQYLKLKNQNEEKFFQDKMEANNILVEFDDNEQIDLIILSKMASTDFSIIRDGILKGVNQVSGDTISIKFLNDAINQMYVKGGAIGEFIPDKENKDIANIILYKANRINYNLDKETTLLTDNAEIVYGNTILMGGEIEVNLNLNLVESKIKDSIFPSVSSGEGSPTYGEYMIFDLETEIGNITGGYNEVDMSIFRGDQFLTDANENVNIKNGIFTSCDLETPHYHFGSKNMKIIERKNQIVTGPMILYIQDFPALVLPFTILPNSTKKSKSGFIMPSFGHSNTTGTWIEDLGYYYAPNDYYDIITYIDFYDQQKFKMDTRLRYKKLYGDKWYNYNFLGDLKLKNYIRKLEISNDFTDLGDKSVITENYSLIFNHKQDFDTGQYIRINYEYYNFEDLSSIIENDINIRLDQQEESRLYYAKNWPLSSLSIGSFSKRHLAIPEPDNIDDSFTYKNEEYPSINYSYRKPLLFGRGDKWYHNMSLSYTTAILNQYRTYTKEAKPDTTWGSNVVSILSPGANHTLNLSLPLYLPFFSVTPNISFYEKWALSDGLNNISARSSDYSISLNIQTTLFGLFHLNMGKFSAIRHIMTPSISFSHNPESKITKGDIIDFDNNRISVNTASSMSSTISLNNLFQAKIRNVDNEYIKRNFIGINFSTSYDFQEEKFGDLFSTISLKNKMGGEYLRIRMQHSVRNIFEGRYPELKTLTTSLSRRFGYKLAGESPSEDENIVAFGTEENLDSFNGDLNRNTQTHDVWDAQFGIALTAKYNLEDKWDIEYSNLSINSNVNLSKEWKINNQIYLNLVDMNIEDYKIEFTRSLHCWDFVFFMRPIGYNQGFGLRINISDPGLQSLRATQSTVKGSRWK